MMNRFGDVDYSFKKLPPVYGFQSEQLVSIDKALEPLEQHIHRLSHYIKIAKKYCLFPNKHGLSQDQSASIYIYTMEWGETTLYRVLNKALRSENRVALKIWFPYLKLLDTALDLLPTHRGAIWRGVPLDIGKNFTKDQIFTWWAVSSCSSSVNVIETFFPNTSNTTLFLIETINGRKVSGYTQFEKENEIILKSGTEFQVCSDPLKRPDGSYTVHLIELNDDGDESSQPLDGQLSTEQILMAQIDKLEEYTTPRYFFILPAKDSDLHFKLYFLCECSNDPKELHVASADGYSIRKLKEFIIKYGQYLRITLAIVKDLQIQNENINNRIEFTQQFLDKPEIKRLYASFPSNENNNSLVKTTHLQELENYLERYDSKHFLGNLYPLITEKGCFRWFCQQHYDIISVQRNIDFVSQIRTLGGKFDQEKKEFKLNGITFTNQNVKLFSEILLKGFIVSRVVLENSSIYESDFDLLIEFIINQSSIQCFKIQNLNMLNYLGFSKYICIFMKVSFINHLLEIRFTNQSQYTNVEMFRKILSQNRTYRSLHIYTHNFLQYEQQLQRYLDSCLLFTELIVDNANHCEMLNAIFNWKIRELKRLKFNDSLLSSTVEKHFCQLLKTNQTIVELDLIDATDFYNKDFLKNLFEILKFHKSIKLLRLHISYLEQSNEKETLLIDCLQNNRFLTHLRLSKSKISSQLSQQLIISIEKHQSLVYLEFYHCMIDENDVKKLQTLENNGYLANKNLFHHFQVASNLKWKQHAKTIAGGNGKGDKSNQFNGPYGMYIDHQQEVIYIADCYNHRIVKWKLGKKNGEIIAGGNGQGNGIDQLYKPSDKIIDGTKRSLITCVWGTSRIVRWSLENLNDKEIIIENSWCYGLMMNKNDDLFVSDYWIHAVKRWRKNEKGDGTIIAGGNGCGNKLNQLNQPTYIFVDQEEAVYISDFENHRVMKWSKDAKEGIVVAGGQGRGNSLKQLNCPHGLVVTNVGDIYVADSTNNRIMCWSPKSKEGRIVVGGNGEGNGSNQLNYPISLSFDADNNLYVVDSRNNRIQRFSVDF